MVLATVTKPEPKGHEKKRHGAHHKSSARHYAKTYWPYLPMLLIVLMGFFTNLVISTSSGVLGYATNMSNAGLLQETNIQRSQNGLPALSLNNLLSQAAQQKANDMVARNYWSHTSPEGTEPWEIIASVGYTFVTAGENLAYGFDDSAGALAGWMNSSSHRANVLNTNYQEVGFGIANSNNYQSNGEQTVVVAMYGKPKVLATAPAPKAVAKPKAVAQTPEPIKQSEPTPTPVTQQPAPAAPPVEAPATPKDQPAKEDTVVAPVKELPPKEIATVDILTAGNAQWASIALILLVSIGAISFIYRHAKMWRKFLLQGEAFVIHHPLLDIIIVAVVVLGFLLTRTTGFIH